MNAFTTYPATESPGTSAAISIRRYVNNEIAQQANPFEPEGELEFLCECGDLACARHARMTLSEYHQTAPGSVVAHSM